MLVIYLIKILKEMKINDSVLLPFLPSNDFLNFAVPYTSIERLLYRALTILMCKFIVGAG